MANLRGRVVAELDAPRGIIPGRDAVGNDVDRVVGFGGEARAGFLNEGEVRLSPGWGTRAIIQLRHDCYSNCMLSYLCIQLHHDGDCTCAMVYILFVGIKYAV